MTAMPISGPVPEWLLSAVAALTLFAVMFDLGLIIVPGEFRWVAERPSLMAKALFAVVVAVPAIAWAVARVMDLPRAAEIGIMLMAIAPGAPVALRNALVAGGHRAFAPALQISLAIVAIASMPLFVAAFDEYYAGEASVDPRHLARQVFFAQLLPLALGVVTMRLWPAAASPRCERPRRSCWCCSRCSRWPGCGRS
jgi:BASS family bile acid:Na+ symporter